MTGNVFKTYLAAGVDLFYPLNCLACGGALPEESASLCRSCQSTMLAVGEQVCPRCTQPFAGESEEPFLCPNCAGRKMYVDCAVAAWRSRGVVRELVHRFKYSGHLFLRHQLTEWLLDGYQDERMNGKSFDYLTPVPLHWLKQCRRGYNQAAELAEALSREIHLPVRRFLKRIRHTKTQTALDRNERMENLQGCFKMRHGRAVTGRNILLIDDILTTGSTVDECARTLLAGGASSVCALTVARG